MMVRRIDRSGGVVATCLVACLIGCVNLCEAEEVQQFPFRQIPSYNDWPTTWTPLAGLNDGNDLTSDDHLDFVGDGTDPGAFWAQDNKYVYFRVRTDVGAVVTDATNPDAQSNTFGDTVHVLIDQVGVGVTDLPDFGFSWDSKEKYAEHGLEMTEFDSITGTTWGTMKMDDVDGLDAKKGPEDFNGNGRTGDGYLRTIDNVSTTNFGTTTFIDYAISWEYLTKYSTTTLRPGQTWRVALGSIANANDHNLIDTDIAGGASPSSPIADGWSDPIQTQAVPEPSSIALLGLVVVVGYAGRRLRRRRPGTKDSTDAGQLAL